MWTCDSEQCIVGSRPLQIPRDPLHKIACGNMPPSEPQTNKITDTSCTLEGKSDLIWATIYDNEGILNPRDSFSFHFVSTFWNIFLKTTHVCHIHLHFLLLESTLPKGSYKCLALRLQLNLLLDNFLSLSLHLWTDIANLRQSLRVAKKSEAEFRKRLVSCIFYFWFCGSSIFWKIL